METVAVRSIPARRGLGKYSWLVSPLVSGLPFVPLESVTTAPLVTGLPFVSLLSGRNTRSDFLLQFLQLQPDFAFLFHS